ncbi:hypothetical protein Hypma_004531 [Hypsizygus marmoreus]|uniref:Uncharacterized protein n=1 Tax=Hypsizygus marmoreus TaxID=39966 RepID=A0A369K624_HYPMA|nr:hypothetical protein Hypma_004531 [Hypsizygus marmoreus]
MLHEDELTRDMVASILATRASWERFKEKIINSIHKDKREMENTVLSNIKRRLVKLGYSHADRQRLFSTYSSSFQIQFNVDEKNPARYIRRSWPSLRTRIHSSMTELREQFEMIEHRRIVSRRKSVIRNVHYESFNFDTSFPTAQGVPFFEPFYTLVNSPSSESLDPLEIKEEILKFMERWPP